MTREEEIKQQSIIYAENRCNHIEYGDYWETYNDIEYVEKAFKEGAEWADKTMIEKSCEIAKDILSSYSFANYPHEMQDFLIDFRKAMEE